MCKRRCSSQQAANEDERDRDGDESGWDGNEEDDDDGRERERRKRRRRRKSGKGGLLICSGNPLREGARFVLSAPDSKGRRNTGGLTLRRVKEQAIWKQEKAWQCRQLS